MTSGQSTTPDDENMTVEDVARELHRKDRSTRELLRTKVIPSFREGRRLLVRRVDFRAYVAKRAAEAEAKSKEQDTTSAKAGDA